MKTYQRISCDYYDNLEAWATLKTLCHIIYLSETGEQKSTQGLITDLFAENHAEYMVLNNGLTIRLDYILSINDKPMVYVC
jgi:Rho-binding antiterminator